MLELIEKKYSINVKFLDSKDYKVEYGQAKFKEVLEFQTIMENEKALVEWLYFFIKSNCKQKVTKKMFNQLKTNHINKILDFILKTYFQNFYKKSEKNDVQKSPTSSFIAFILQYTNETVESLMNMTWQSIEYIMEGIVWNLKEQTPQGKAENRRQFELKKCKEEMSDEEALQLAKSLEKKLDTIKFEQVSSKRI